MSDDKQSYSHHTRWDPAFHFFVLPVAILTVLGILYHAIRNMVRHPDPHTVINNCICIVMAAALFVLVTKVRMNALKVQDRVIRLEERLRLATLLPENLRARIPELTQTQLIALRFASDAELPALALRTLNEKLDADTIKKSIQNWRPDNVRV